MEAQQVSEIYARKPLEARRFIVQLVDHFGWKNHYCLAFEKLSFDLYEFLKINNHAGLY